ncbi:MAG TPA: dihydroorotate dehydrogenase-like protein [Bacteroidota bacterium]|jgi:dihydroorotate dehydrogenase (fumarate)|nr:dihydroorotate dehydrogenase-like protein [Bacteroidota bacterium]
MDLTTKYLGLDLKNPIVPSAGPLSKSLDNVRILEDSGASAIVMFSLFEEQIAHEAAELEHYLSYGTESYAESLTYFPSPSEYNLGPDEYIELIHKIKQSVNIPVIGSINGITTGGWLEYAKKIEQAGADALELNIYYIPTDLKLTSLDVENRYIEILSALKQIIRIPIAVKLSPYFSSFANFASRLVNAGADGLVLFNRFYQPDINLESLEVEPNITFSSSNEIKLPLRWIAILYSRLKCSFAATSGVYTPEDAIKLLMVGSDVVMMCSALLKNGPRYLKSVLDGIDKWMFEHEYTSVQQMKGSMSQKSILDPAAFERANYMKALNRFK